MMKKHEGKKKNHFFWTLPQHNLLNDHSEAMSRLILMADFGTGKTSLLFEKASRLLMQEKSVVVVIFEVGNSSKDEDSSSTASKIAVNESLLTTQFQLKLCKVGMKCGAHEVVGLTGKGNVGFYLLDVGPWDNFFQNIQIRQNYYSLRKAC